MSVSDVREGKAVESNDASVVIEEDAKVTRSANWLDVAYHSVTGMVGAGVLGLPAAFAHLGWAGGLIMLMFSFWVSWYTYKLLVYMHEVPDLDCKAGQGIRRLDRYDQLADYLFGRGRGKAILLPFQIAVLVGIAITYTVLGGSSLLGFSKLVNPSTATPVWVFIIVFGGLQLLLSLLPSFNELSWVSLVGACMSVCYCTIAVAMAGSLRPAAGSVNYDPANVQRTPVERVMGIFNALTSILFAYGGHNVALEIQATIPITSEQPSTVPPMMRGVNITFVVTGLAYFAVSIVGFWAFGTSVADNVLMSFARGPRSWVVAMADMMVVVHVASAYQVYMQPVYQLIEYAIKRNTGAERVGPVLRVGIRLVFVVLITVVAIVVPFFGSLMGLIGAITVTPTTFLLPPLLWLLYKRPNRWGIEWSVNWFLVWVTGLLGVLGTIGAIYGIISAWHTYKIFAS